MDSQTNIVIRPRNDGQYSDHATDVLALLEEAGVRVAYATDPKAAGVFAEKTAETILPPLVIVLSDAGTVLTAIQGVVIVVKWFLRGRPRRHKVVLDVDFQKTEQAISRSVHIESDDSTVDELEALLREASGLWPDEK